MSTQHYNLIHRVEIAAKCAGYSTMVAAIQAQSVVGTLGEAGERIKAAADRADAAVKELSALTEKLALAALNDALVNG